MVVRCWKCKTRIFIQYLYKAVMVNEIALEGARNRYREGKPVRVLFVCLGNICRSPAAEGVMRALVEERGDAAAVGDRFGRHGAITISAICLTNGCAYTRVGAVMSLRIVAVRCASVILMISTSLLGWMR